MTKKQQDFLSAVKTHFGDITTINRAQLLELSQVNASISKYPPKWLKANLVARGEYALDVSSVPVVQEERPEISQESVKGVPSTDDNPDISFIPSIDRDYVAWGNHKTVEKVIKSKLFYPIFITGLSGNGKTFMTEQVCAKLKREMIRVNITIETDEDDLLGGFRLVDGETVFHKGPGVDAMERGAVLLLDEVDLASNKILCVQPVLEGKGVYLKKINQWVTPAEGFTIIATANTKGKGSESGAFIGTNILNEAFLERFAVTIEQEYPTVGTEKKILGRVFNTLGIEDPEFAAKLVDWADIIRRTYYDGGIDEVVSTRRLVHISKAFSIFEDRMQAIDLCINRFDDETKESFKDLYSKIDAEVEEVPEDPNFSTEIQSDNLEQTSGDMPF